MSVANRIKTIIIDYIKDLYFNYLNNNDILIIEEKNIKNIITSFYNENVKEIKNSIRLTLKNELKDDYPTATIENTLFDLFEDNELNINRILIEIQNYQNSIIKIFDLNIYNNNIGIKININKNVEIVNAENPNKDNSDLDNIYNEINNYKFIYSINDTILSNIDNENKVSCIKNLINNNKNLKLTLVK